MRFRRVGIIGVGLIGGSFALALKTVKAVDTVVGFGRTRANLDTAKKMGVIDEIGADWDALTACDLILLAVPVGQLPAIMPMVGPRIGPDTVVTDAGSTKRDIVAYARAAFGNALPRFVPAHPIAGAEKSGAGAARPNLFNGKPVVLTPIPETDPYAFRRVRAVWQLTGAQTVRMDVALHDTALAATSHLPHVLAFAMMNEIAQRPEGEAMMMLTGGGFRDFTRIAASSPEMWRDICLANRDTLCAEIDAFTARLGLLRGYIAAGDGAAL
ncbi:MAG: prephenate dehydrogenase/arogenate dehydrogenase family protein, partial [Proteobacteria bacterium]|nr:prephenate dehydrogenase/arogenate dehydrogenase family protein [Burkholderiales bacterium]